LKSEQNQEEVTAMRHILPETGYVRLSQIIGNPKADPPIPPIIPVSRSTWLEGVKTGRYPQSVKLSPRVTAWRVSDIRALIENPPE
jgi:prophage regulatory protein